MILTRQIETTGEAMYLDTQLLSNVIEEYKVKQDWNGIRVIEGLVAEIQKMPMFCISTKMQVLR